ncbi:MAG: O-antigen ligase family protein [Defluviitaleaceae bacterium]|nr:O-antigen ligase family protein [Defluviitaleaceae bacterium]
MAKKKNNQVQFSDILVGAMLLLVVAVMPLVARAVEVNVPLELVGIIPHDSEGRIVDVFTYWKGMLVYLAAVVIGFYLVSEAATAGVMPDFKKIFAKPPVFLSCAYLVMVIISVIASSYTRTSLFGTADRSEGMFMWMAYIVVFFGAINYVREVKFAKVLMYGLIFSSIVMGAIGAGQLFGFDFFDSGLAVRLVIPGGEWHMSTVFDIAHGTLFNPNTFGKYTAMLSPLLLLAALTYDGKFYVRILFLVAGGLMLLSVFGSSSLGGLVGIVAAVGVLAVTFLAGFINRRRGDEPEKLGKLAKVTGIGTVAVVASMLLAILFVPPLNDRVTFLFNRMGDAMRAETTTGYNFVTEGDTMQVFRDGEKVYSIVIREYVPGIEQNVYTIVDAAGNDTAFVGEGSPLFNTEGGQITPPASLYYVPGYGNVSVISARGDVLFNNFILTLYDGRIHVIRPGRNDYIDLSVPVPAWGFYGRETWGSNRGYIWSRTFPLMPRRVIAGSGPDTFTSAFPNHDIVSAQRFFNAATTVDKAHNIFLQTWVTTGGISAILLFGLFFHYMFTTFVSLVKSKGEQMFSYGLRLGLLAAVSGFVMSSMATDSTVGSTGVFFVLLGMGYGLNYCRAKDEVILSKN